MLLLSSYSGQYMRRAALLARVVTNTCARPNRYLRGAPRSPSISPAVARATVANENGSASQIFRTTGAPDFFGIEDTSGVKETKDRPAEDDVDVLSMMQQQPQAKGEDKVYVTSYGKIRLDVDNQPTFEDQDALSDLIEQEQPVEQMSHNQDAIHYVAQPSYETPNTANEPTTTSKPSNTANGFFGIEAGRDVEKTKGGKKATTNTANKPSIEGEHSLADETSLTSHNVESGKQKPSTEKPTITSHSGNDFFGIEVGMGVKKMKVGKNLHKETKPANSDSDNKNDADATDLNFIDEQYFSYQGSFTKQVSTESADPLIRLKPFFSMVKELSDKSDDSGLNTRTEQYKDPNTSYLSASVTQLEADDMNIFDQQYICGESTLSGVKSAIENALPSHIIDGNVQQDVNDVKGSTLGVAQLQNEEGLNVFDEQYIRGEGTLSGAKSATENASPAHKTDGDVQQDVNDVKASTFSAAQLQNEEGLNVFDEQYICGKDSTMVNQGNMPSLGTDLSTNNQTHFSISQKQSLVESINDNDIISSNKKSHLPPSNKTADLLMHTQKDNLSSGKKTAKQNKPKLNPSIDNFSSLERPVEEKQYRHTSLFDTSFGLSNLNNSDLHPKGMKKQDISKVMDHSEPEKNHGEIVTAYDYVCKKRKEENEKAGGGQKDTTEQLDSKGYRVLKNLVEDFSKCSQETIAFLLKKGILYNSNDIVALNKPYGLSTYGDSESDGVPSISVLLPKLARMLDQKSRDPQLHLVHTLEKSVTGVMLLAKTPQMANILKTSFANGDVTCLYWGLTCRIPEPDKGIIDIPITPGTIDGKARMHLNPDVDGLRLSGKAARYAQKAVTEYRVIGTGYECALVEILPKTDVKHQLRVHFGFGLNCPFLGDHKFSHRTKLAPQKLSGTILQRLGVRQSKVRHMALHLHLRSVVVPEFLEGGKNLFISANLPRHFKDSMKRLKLKKT